MIFITSCDNVRQSRQQLPTSEFSIWNFQLFIFCHSPHPKSKPFFFARQIRNIKRHNQNYVSFSHGKLARPTHTNTLTKNRNGKSKSFFFCLISMWMRNWLLPSQPRLNYSGRKIPRKPGPKYTLPQITNYATTFSLANFFRGEKFRAAADGADGTHVHGIPFNANSSSSAQVNLYLCVLCVFYWKSNE